MQMPIYYLDANEYGNPNPGTFVVQTTNDGAQLQNINWNGANNEWVIASPPYDAPVNIDSATAQYILENNHNL